MTLQLLLLQPGYHVISLVILYVIRLVQMDPGVCSLQDRYGLGRNCLRMPVSFVFTVVRPKPAYGLAYNQNQQKHFQNTN